MKKSKKLNSDFNHLSGVLSFELMCRKDLNASYSLRAFSKQLSIAPSQLSLILKNKKGISVKKAQVVAKALGYDSSKQIWFEHLVQKDFSKSPSQRKISKDFIKKYKNGVLTKSVSQPKFKIDWYHFAIRRMTLLEDFKLDAKWISQRLGINQAEADQAINDLKKHKLIRKNKSKYTSINNLSFYFNDENAAQRLLEINDNLTKKMNEKIMKNKENNIYYGSHYLTINSSKLKNIKKISKNFEDQIDDLTYKKNPHDSVIVVKLEIVRLDEV